MPNHTVQDAQIFKERCEDSPGIVVLCQGDWRPTPERVRMFEEQNYYVLTAANGFQDSVDWLAQARCMGAMFAHPATVSLARQQYPDKVIERFEGVGARFLRTLSQELPFGLHNAGYPFTGTVPSALKTVDVVSAFSPVALKRGALLLESLLASDATAYLFAQSMGGKPELLDALFEIVRQAGKSIEYFHYPFDPYALMRIDGRIVIDGRPIGANNSLVSAYLARARLLVHTSTTEGISNSVMEALLNDVPVLLCEDIRGPLQNLSLELSDCITRCAPNTQALVKNIHQLLASPRVHGSVRASFSKVINPFEINRHIVRGTQQWFARNGLPWKGHCLGLLGGVQSKIDLANVSAEESYRGHLHIYPSAAESLQNAAFQLQIAEAIGAQSHAASLRAEMQYIQNGMAVPALETKAFQAQSIHAVLATIAADHDLRHVFVAGAANPFLPLLASMLEKNQNRPQLHVMESRNKPHALALQHYAHSECVHCHHASTVPLEAFPTALEVSEFYASSTGKLKDYPLGTVLQWLAEDIADINTATFEKHGIQSLMERLDIDNFDVALIDGREFTGFAEFQKLYGCKFFLLACTTTFKNHQSMQQLVQDPNYQLVFADANVCNGFAFFAKR
jgi:hypothetical protein